MRTLFRPIVCLALMLPGLAAAQATPQGAADLTAVFQTYLGKTPGVVSVVADGDAYAVTLDAGPIVAKIPAGSGATVSVSPIEMRLTDNNDGTWGVVQDQALRLSAVVPGQLDISVAADRAACRGIFDSALKAFVQNDCEIDVLSIDQVTEDPVLGRQVTTQVSERLVTSSTGKPGATGGVDGSYTYAESAGRAVIEGPLAPGADPVTLTVAYVGTRYEGTAAGVRNADLLAALAWAVANPGEAAMAANRGEIKRILSAGLPLFEEIDVKGTVSDLTVQSPVGVIASETVGFGATVRGAVADGLYRVAIDFAGLTLPTDLVPPFAQSLVPETLSLDLAASGYDAASAAVVLLDLLDLAPGTEPGPEFGGRFLSALLPYGTVDITLALGSVGNATYALTYQGGMTAGPSGPLSGSATVTATGLDAVMAALDTAPQEMKDQILPVIGIARGLSQPGTDGALVWEIDATTPGAVLINGMDLMQMAP